MPAPSRAGNERIQKHESARSPARGGKPRRRRRVRFVAIDPGRERRAHGAARPVRRSAEEERAMGDVELVGLYWTLSGPVEVHVGREWTHFDFRDRCEEPAKVGFSGIGIWHAALEQLLESRSLAELKEILDANGIRADELEFLMDWWLDPGDEQRRAADEQRRMVFEAAAVLEPHHIKVGNIPGATVPFDRLTERFAELCAGAAHPPAPPGPRPACAPPPPTPPPPRSPPSSCRSPRT